MRILNDKHVKCCRYARQIIVNANCLIMTPKPFENSWNALIFFMQKMNAWSPVFNIKSDKSYAEHEN